MQLFEALLDIYLVLTYQLMLCAGSEDSCWVSSGSFPQTVVVSLPHSANIETVQLHSYNGH